MSYVAPIKDMLFDIRYLANIDQVAELPGFEDAGFDTAQAVLEEAAKFNEGVLSPLNWEGDKNPSWFKDGQVTTTAGMMAIPRVTMRRSTGGRRNRRKPSITTWPASTRETTSTVLRSP